MAVHQLNLATLMELDGGRVTEAFQQEIKRLVADCEDRPGEAKPRKILLELELVPVMFDGHIDSIDGKFRVKSTVPVRRSKKYNFGVRRGGFLVFNDLSDGDINQKTIE